MRPKIRRASIVALELSRHDTASVPSDYAGAHTTATIDDVIRLGAAQLKVDGCYVKGATDSSGRIRFLFYRSGADVSASDAGDFIGLPIGLPSATFHGELEAQTEAGIRLRETRGVPHLHLFDLSRHEGIDISRVPYQDRYRRLHQWQAAIECGLGEHETRRPNGWHSAKDGRWVRPVAKNLPRLPILPIARGKAAIEELWHAAVERGDGEGIVGLRLDAPLGARGAKRKCKRRETIDAVVLSRQGGVAYLDWRGHRFAVSCRGRVGEAIARELEAGRAPVVEVAHMGWYEYRVIPRHARIVRLRSDLGAARQP